jgi:phage N-6-adenine-methyltransferase
MISDLRNVINSTDAFGQQGRLPKSKQDYETPINFFRRVELACGKFDLDVCATFLTTKCERFYDKRQNGLKQPWTGRCWCNPPYGPAATPFLLKGRAETRAGRAAVVVYLLPSRTDANWFHYQVLPYVSGVCFWRGRLSFGSWRGAPFPSMVAIMSAARPGPAKLCHGLVELARSAE